LRTLHVNLAKHRYPIFVGENLFAGAGALLARCGFDAAPIVVTNNTVLRLHGDVLMRSLRRTFGQTAIIRIGDGERFKNHESLLKIYREMFRAQADRRSWILAFGGGVIGDIAGFAAATFMRGIPFAMAPTTLLSQVDSSIGGKVGINVTEGKNLIGAFHQPSAVLSDTGVLKTLTGRELASGLHEVIKCGAIRSRPLLRYIEQRLPEILNCDVGVLQHAIIAAARIKADVVASDERENGLRMILNYGHTVGHALESATYYGRFKHGEGVAWGMIAALAYGMDLGMLSAEDAAWIVRLIRQVGPLPSLKSISFAKVWSALTRDKKFRSGNIRMVFLRRLGEAEIRTNVDSSSLKKFLKRFLDAGGNVI
jgi:3-dehydroquinate synthase